MADRWRILAKEEEKNNDNLKLLTGDLEWKVR